jgi:hypothetical protein
MAERVLGDRCPTGENAALLAAVYARYDWPIGDLLRHAGPIETHQYPLAQSVVAHLESLGRWRFAGFVRSLKAGEGLAAALQANYDGMTFDQLETGWRSSVRRADKGDEVSETTPGDGS